MPRYADRVQETTTTTGTGTITLAGAVTGYQAFSSAYSNGDRVSYAIVGSSTEWEVGEGTYSAGTLTRENVISSSAGAGTLVNFSAGTKSVWVDVPAVSIIDSGLSLAFSQHLVRQ